MTSDFTRSGPSHDSEENAGRSQRPSESRHPSSAQQDYSVVMLVKTVGSLVGAPVMTLAWVKGIGLGGAALGLPYFLSAVSANLAYGGKEY